MQITRAMEMVSSVKLRRANQLLDQSRPYYYTVLENIREVLSEVDQNSHPLLKEREVKTTLLIVLASDRGLAGGYNSNINRLTNKVIEETQGDVKLLTIGHKPYDYFKNRVEIVKKYTGIGEDPSFNEAEIIGCEAMDLYRSGEVDSIKLVYSHFRNLITYDTTVYQLFPSEEIKTEETEGPKRLMEFEPSSEVVLDYLIPMYINSAIYGAMIEASVSEQAARQVAMESATDNAEELRDELELRYNRMRQEAITMEITEIVSGANALE